MFLSSFSTLFLSIFHHFWPPFSHFYPLHFDLSVHSTLTIFHPPRDTFWWPLHLGSSV